MVERDIEPVDPQSYRAFTDFVESRINWSDPLKIDIMSDVERINLLDTENERNQYKSSLYSIGILSEARSCIISPQYVLDGEILATRIGLAQTKQERQFIKSKTDEIVQFMKDEKRVEDYFTGFDINMTSFDFDRVKYNGGSMQGPDAFGFSEVLHEAKMIAGIELDRRIKRPYSKTHLQEQFDEFYTKTGQDLTGATYLRLTYLPKVEVLYHEAINNIKPKATYSHEELEKMIAGMSYPSTLFVVDKYEEIIKEYLGLIS